MLKIRRSWPWGQAILSLGGDKGRAFNNRRAARVPRLEPLEDRQLLATAVTQAAISITDTSAVLNGSVNPNGSTTNAFFQYSTDPSLAPHVVTTFAGTAGTTGGADGTGAAARFNFPIGTAVDTAGNVYVADAANDTIRKITPAGVVTTLAGTAGAVGSVDGTGAAARFNSPGGVVVDGAGNVYVSDAFNDTIRKVTPGGVVTTLAGTAGAAGSADGTGAAARFDNPVGVAVDTAGNLYVAEFNNSTIRKVTPGGVVTTLAGTAGVTGGADGTGAAAQFNHPFGLTIDTAGNLYVADAFNNTIRKVTPAGAVTTLAGTAGAGGSADGTGATARFLTPAGVAVDGAGNVYVAEASNGTIRKVTPAGVVTTLAGTAGAGGSADGTGAAARFNVPEGVAVDTAGNLYVSDRANNTIRKVSTLTIAAQGGLTGSAALPVSANLAGLAPTTTYYFRAAANDAAGSVVGAILSFTTLAPITPGAVDVAAIEAQPFSGEVATFTVGNPANPVSNYAASIDWGDGTPATAGIITRDAVGTFHVAGDHTYAEEGSDSITVTIQNISNDTTVEQVSPATVADAPLTAQVVPVFATEGVPLNNVPIVAFQDTNPNSPASDFPLSNITIDWGDGTGTSNAVTLSAIGVVNNKFSYVASGSHTYTKAGSYTVHVTVNDLGGAVIDAFGAAVIANAAIAVNGVNASPTEGTPFSGTVATFTDAGPQVPSLPSDYSAVITWGDGVTNPGTVAANPGGPGFIVTGTHTFEEGSFLAGVVVTDKASGQSFQASTTFTVADAALTGAAGIPVAAVAGRPLDGVPVATFTDSNPLATTSDYTAAIDWGDGTTSAGSFTIVTRSANATVVQVVGSHTYTMTGVFPTGVTVTDVGGQTVAIPQQMATVAAAPLTVQGVAISAVEGAAVPPNTIVAIFTDANPGATVGDYIVGIRWGDGSPVSAGTISQMGGPGSQFQVTPAEAHIYAEEGTYSITVQIAHRTVSPQDPNGSAIATGTATVADAPLTASGVANLSTTVGTALPATTVVASFTDADPSGTVADFTATINWGDGTVTAGKMVAAAAGGFEVTGGHTYAAVGAFSVTVAIADAGGSMAAAASTSNVNDAPIAIVATPARVVEGLPFAGEVATFTSGNPSASASGFTATIDWGDGSPVSAGTIGKDAAGTFHVNGMHTYAEEGSFKPVVTVLGVTSTATTVPGGGTILVSDAPLIGSPRSVTATVGQAFTGVVASFVDTDPNGTVADYSATIDWGDGTPASAGQVAFDGAGGFTVSGTHVYVIPLAIGGSAAFTITTTIKDVGGATVTVRTPATINAVSNNVIGPFNLSGQLNPASDSGESQSDAITRVNQPAFYGNAQPGSIIVLSAQPTNGGAPSQIARAVTDASGSWTATSILLADGTYIITATTKDAFGNPQTTTILPASHPLEIDTVGPKVTAVRFNRISARIDVTFRDDRSGMARASVVDAANYSLTRPHTRPGTFLVNVISSTPAGTTGPDPGALTINNGRKIRGGLFTLIVRSGGIRDVAGNALDGQFYGSFPSGNNVPSGNFVAGLRTFHNRVFAPRTLIGHASPVVPPGTPSTGVNFITTADPNLSFQNPGRHVAKAARPPHNKAKAHLAVHDKALSQLSGSGRRHRPG